MRTRLHRVAWTSSVAVTVVCWLVVGLEVWLWATPFDRSQLPEPEASVRIFDRDGELLRESIGSDGHRAVWTDFADINPLLVAATIAVEDHRFFDHRGVDSIAIGRAVVDNLRAGRIASGASTLTMQLAGLLDRHPRTFLGKLGEAMMARRLEAALGKHEILEQYLNRAPYGAQTVGVEAAALRYFGKSTSLLSLAESAVIAGLPVAPSRLNPFRDPGAAKRRQMHVLRRMRETGAATADDVERAMREPLHYQSPETVWLAQHFTDYVLAQNVAPGRIDTTLDLSLQVQAQRAVRDHVASLADTGATNAAVVVVDNRSCEIRAMVGSADYFAEDSGMVNGAVALRQPGSTLKPFAYALAFERGATPATVIADVATHYGTATGSLFSPQNFAKDFSGPVMMGSALGRSLNIPAMRVASSVGVDRLLARLRKAGFDSLKHSADHYGLGLTLGNGEVELLELAQGYAMFARGGLSCEATALAGAEMPEPVRVFSPEAAFLTTDVLSNESFRIAAFGPSTALLLGFPVAVKTGTSSNWRDSWTVGYTRELTVAVWTGDFAGRSMNQLSGAGGAGPLFNRVMTAAVADSKDRFEPVVAPPSVAEVTVCSLSGQIPHEHCAHRVQVRVPDDNIPSETCSWHRRVRIDKRNGLLAGDRCPAEHVEFRVVETLPAEYNAWVARHHATDPGPTRYSPKCPATGPTAGVVAIRYPRDGERFVLEPGYASETQTLELLADVVSDAQLVEWQVDGVTVTRAHWPFTASWQLAPGAHTITARAAGQKTDSVRIQVD